MLVETRRYRRALFTAAAITIAGMSLGMPTSAPAAIIQWDGGGANTNWSTANNWNPNSAPTSNDKNDIEFGSIALVAPNNTTANNTASDFNVNSISFNGTAAVTFSLTGSQFDFQKDGSVQPSINQNSNLTHSIANNLKISGDNFTLGGNGTGLITISGALTGGKPLLKTGTSTYLLTASNNQINGTTTINGGTIIVGDANALDTNQTITVNNTGTLAINTGLTYTRAATFNSGSTLAGKGTYNPGAFSAGSNVTIAPGINDIGTLSMGNNTTFAAGSKFAVSVGSGANNNDRLNVTGILNTSAATSSLLLSMVGANQGKYTLASATSLNIGSNTAANGGFGSVTGLDAAYRLNTTATQVELIHKATIAMDAAGAAQMITGGTISLSGHVANIAFINSDVLTYVLNGSAGVSGLPVGPFNRTAGDINAFAGDQFTGTFTSSTLGLNTYSVTASATSAINSSQTTSFEVNVIDHADGSFDAPSNADLDELSIVFDIAPGQVDSDSFTVSNLFGSRAGLVHVSVDEGAGDDGNAATGAFRNNMQNFGTLAAGSTTGSYNVTFDATSLDAGVYQTTYTLNLYDESMSGMASQTMMINVTGNVVAVPEPGTIGMSVLLVAASLLRRRRTR